MGLRIDGSPNSLHVSSPRANDRVVSRTEAKDQVSKVNFRIPIMIMLSNKAEGKSWGELQNQWEITGYEYFPEGTSDSFCQSEEHVQHLYKVTNNLNGNAVTMGQYDIKYLFSDVERRIRVFHRKQDPSSSLRGKEALNLNLTNFALQAVTAINNLTDHNEIDLRERLGCLLYFSEYLGKDDKKRLFEIVVSRSEVKPPIEIDSRERNFIMYKPLEVCVACSELWNTHPRLVRQINEKNDKVLELYRATRENEIMTYRRMTASTRRIVEGDVAKKKKELESKKYSLWELYVMEKDYRKESAVSVNVREEK